MRELDDSIDALLLKGERVLAHSSRILDQVNRTLDPVAEAVIDLTTPRPEPAVLPEI